VSAFDLRLAEMLASRLCHDLVNPIGAVANGAELMAEFAETMQKDALDLVASSADRAMKRIAFFRAAYGNAGHDEGQSVHDARVLAEGYLAGSKVALDWPARPEDASSGLPRSGLKLVLCLLVLGIEALPRGGTVAVRTEPPSGGRLTASGQSVRLEPAAERMLEMLAAGRAPDPAMLDPKSVSAAYAGRLAQSIGARFAIERGADRLGLTLVLA
jgi:histidine phosphotransferase ChpT